MAVMSVSDFFHMKSRDLVIFSEFEGCKASIIEVDKLGQPKEFRSKEVKSLDKQLEFFSQPTPTDTHRGSLHLLLHRCTRKKAEKAPLPFGDQKTFDTVIEKLKLPTCYPYDYARWQHIPARTTFFRSGVEVVCHTPKFGTTWASLALWYDSESQTTSAFLSVTEGEMEELMVETVNSLKFLASHPLLLPIALYWVTSQILRRDNHDTHVNMNTVQKDTGLLRQYLKVDSTRASSTTASTTEKGNAKTSQQKAPTLTEIHQVIVEQHARLTRGLAEFTEELGASCLSALDSIESMEEDGDEAKNDKKISTLLIDKDAHFELRKLLAHTKVGTNYELHHRKQILSRVEIQQQVLYNLMQSRLGDEALRDSSAMKSIAVLTMVFLPATALATIFSIGAFFGSSPADGHIVVSGEFWLFWAIAIPLTLLVLLIYFLWEQREWLHKQWHREKREDQEAQKTPPAKGDQKRALK
ncbi:uncharacterized protein PV07_00876 [Cladophialophora immunda]|uniref:Uncharacterized protein n=1 Tax=Cladophialophora immunda TaxID=569365 RepID=A0A0D2A109_9EURO|nr:uncharacterized protein PV07_00876 [Cladophialophora immunda]KIW34076.1 hypothetical protein PV07_00876 [Cladophialophora immunda]OQV03020.1 hypothetical protein CLAIMM_08120 [Cladophialophora immunda]